MVGSPVKVVFSSNSRLGAIAKVYATLTLRIDFPRLYRLQSDPALPIIAFEVSKFISILVENFIIKFFSAA